MSLSISAQWYERACAEQGIDPHPHVVAAFNALGASGTSPETPCSLALHNATLGTRGTEALCATLRQLTIESLSCTGTYLGDEGFQILSRALIVQEGTLRQLDLRGNGIRDAAVVAHTVRNMVHLEQLELEWNRLGSDTSAMLSLLQRLADLPLLTRVGLQNNMLDASCVVGLGRLLASGHCTSLDISWNSLGSACAPRLLEGLQTSNAMVQFVFAGNGFTRPDTEAIELRLQANDHSRAQAVSVHTAHELLRRQIEEVRLSEARALERCASAETARNAAVEEVAAAEAKIRNLLHDLDDQRRRSDERLEESNQLARAARDEANASRAKEMASQEDASHRVKAAFEQLDEERARAKTAEGKLQQELADLTRRLHETTNDRDSLRLDLQRATLQGELATKEAEAISGDMKVLRERCTDAEIAHRRSEEALTLRGAELVTKRAEVESLERKLRDVSLSLEKALSDSQSAAELLRTQKEQSERELSMKDEKASREKATMERQISVLVKQLEDSERSRERVTSGLSQEVETSRLAFEARLADLESRLQTRTNEFESKVVELQRTKTELSAAAAEKSRAESLVEQLQRRQKQLLDEAANAARATDSQLTDVVSRCLSREENASNDVDLQHRRIVDLEKQLSAANAHIKALTEKLRKQQSTFENRLFDNLKAAMAATRNPEGE